MFPLLSHHDSRRKRFLIDYPGKYSPAQDEGMIKGLILAPDRSKELAFVLHGFSLSTGDIHSKIATPRSRQKNIVPCEP